MTPVLLQRRFDALSLEEAVAASYGQLTAATAHAHDARSCTRDAADLEGTDQPIDVVSV